MFKRMSVLVFRVRDQVVDMMRGALDQLTEATANVIVSLPFLCRLVSENVNVNSYGS